MKRRPSPALIVAMGALFLALGGAGFAASVAFVKSPKPIALVVGNVSADGQASGAKLKSFRIDRGVYTLTIAGDTFAPSGRVAAVQSLITPQIITIVGSNRVIAPTCDTSGETLASNGSATLTVTCFSFDSASGWQPTDAAFDVQVSGPSR